MSIIPCLSSTIVHSKNVLNFCESNEIKMISHCSLHFPDLYLNYEFLNEFWPLNFS
jgi:hypothetical protein